MSKDNLVQVDKDMLDKIIQERNEYKVAATKASKKTKELMSKFINKDGSKNSSMMSTLIKKIPMLVVGGERAFKEIDAVLGLTEIIEIGKEIDELQKKYGA